MADEESVDYQIRIEAAQALKNLEGLLATASSLPEVIQAVENATQSLADRFGVSFNAAQKEMQETIVMAGRLRAQMEDLQGAASFSPYLQTLSEVQSPFGEMGDAAGWKAVMDAKREGTTLAGQQVKSEAAVAKELNDQAALRQKNLDISNTELGLIEKQGAELQRQLQLYGQVSRTQAESMKYLKSFAGTEHGKSIFSRFFGDYQEAQTVAQQIDSVKRGIVELSTATGTTFTQSAKAFNEQFSQIPGITRQTSQAVKELNSDFSKTEEQTKKAVRGIDAVRIALGAIVAMIVFQVIQAFGNAFREMIANVKEAELALYNLRNAERRLSEEGIDITPEGLQETVDAVRELVPVLSQIQAEELVSRIATNVAPALKLTAEQIRQMAEAIAILYVRNKALGKSFDEVEAQVTNAFLTGKVSQGINQLGVKISDQIVRDEALRLGLVKTEDEFNNLSGEVEAHVKSVAMLSVVYKNATGDVESLGQYMETFDAQSERSKTAWSDLLTTLGKVFGGPLAAFMGIIATRLEAINAQLMAIQGPLDNVAIGFSALFKTYEKVAGLPPSVALMTLLSNPGQTWGEFVENVKKAEASLKALKDTVDTPTSPNMGLNTDGAIVDLEKLQEKIEDIIKDTNDDFVDLGSKLRDKLEDINLEYERKATDAETDYLRKVEDINRDYAQRIQDIKNKQRDQDKKDEEKYQLALWELRMRYLMDLEDALHARDARQILRLQKEYALDKAVLEKKHALDTKQREQDQRAELDDAARKRDQALADAKLTYDRKLADQQIAKQRELDDLQVWYMRELQDLQTAQERKMQQLLKGWIDEQKITAENAAAVYGILSKYFGPGGMTDRLYQYMTQSLIANTQAAISALGSIGSMSMAGAAPARSGGGSVGGRPMGIPNGARAEGGSILATKPTTVTFGEAGAEAALFLPMNKIGRNSGRVDLSGNMGGGMDGTIVVQLDLSPDLEARVIENSMNGVANIVTKINRSKL